MLKHLALFVLIFSLVGCTEFIETMKNPNYPVVVEDPSSVAHHTRVDYSEHQGLISINGPQVLGNFYGTNLLRATKYMKYPYNFSNIQIYIIINMADWKKYTMAFSYGKEYNITQISHELTNCHRYEKKKNGDDECSNRQRKECGSDVRCNTNQHLAVNISLDDLNRFAETGFTFELAGKNRKQLITIPASYFAGFRQVALNAGQEPAPSPAQTPIPAS